MRFNPDEVLVPVDLLGNEGEWYEDEKENGDSEGEKTNGDTGNNVTKAAEPPANGEAEELNVPGPAAPPTTPPAPIPRRLPDGLDAPEPNTGRGFRARPPPGHYARMQSAADFANFANLAYDEPDDLICALVIDTGFEEDKYVPDEYALAAEPGDEPTWCNAINGPDHKEWLAARDRKMKMIEDMKTYELVFAPPGANIIDTHNICKKKCDETGTVTQYKVWFVAGGHQQIYGVDYTETWAPMASIATHRANLAYATQHN